MTIDNLIIGLGNSGLRYHGTRHNAGFLLIDFLADGQTWSELKSPSRLELVWRLGRVNCLVCKPQTFMNQSGKVAVKLKQTYPKLNTTHWWVAHDDLDIPLGKFKLQFGRGPKKHHGLESFYQALGTTNIWHLRLGVDNRQGNRSIPGSEYVLQQFSTSERSKLNSAILQASIELKRQLLAG